MSIEKVRKYLAQWGKEDEVREFDVSSATVELAALALGTEEKRIAKTLAFASGEGAILVVAAGDAKIDNRSFKDTFKMKAKMLTPDKLYELTGHKVGGVCPFAIPKEVPIYLDESLKRFESVYPACGTANSAIKLGVEELFEISRATSWVDVCKDWRDA
jgi:prolyl-tRNA editing enzyme YbaK/EbsC (Cys-tRNA(Pro) deacylase)